MADNRSSNFNNKFDKIFEDKNNNGIPDFFEHTTKDGQHFSIHHTHKITVNGKEYKSMDEVPAAEKEMLTGILKRFDTSTSWNTNTAGILSTKPKESKIVFSENEETSKKISGAKILNIILIILLAIAAWFIWGKVIISIYKKLAS
ncbi:MAG: hypothetical protein IPJ81_15355 [Chitinophagaceae bacterium]|nr:hypothetical protein [Chitinophagaceae bacterium]